jgi:hypothetical protein
MVPTVICCEVIGASLANFIDDLAGGRRGGKFGQ